MLKHIVICGPVFQKFDARISHLIQEAGDKLGDHEQNLYPERYVGAQQVRELVQSTIKTGYPSVFLTRYEHAVSEFAIAVCDGKLNSNEVQFWLVQYKGKESEQFIVTEHMIENEQLNNDWPFGIIA